ncbi:MAG: DUF4380 domain-containing protein [Armatimonadota bacterium]|nr:DUF4380 domain-containing protein [Armatimonadota bacterium]MCX7776818.1 DUF4380 domain-containing protein [Armatimonadota bacterium]MDW8024613.1 DUF4380 domain-containing protein [Armatimonadota bacterium]
MKRREFISPAIVLCAWISIATSQVKVEQISYRGWDDSYRITNGIVEVVVVPKIGRIMSYRFVGGENILWENEKWFGKLRADAKPNEWANFGGDKVWPGPQNQWKEVMGRSWPPDEAFDGGECTANELVDGVELVTPVSPHYGAWLVREIRLSADSTRLTIKQRLEKLRLPIVDMLIWSVTQIRSPDLVLLPIDPKSKFENGFTILGGGDVEPQYRRREGNFLLVRRHPLIPTKVGTDSTECWLASFHGNVLFTQHAKFVKDAVYPDGGCTVEVYTNPDELPYVELELMSPIFKLGLGEEAQFDISWQLHKLEATPKNDYERLQILKKLTPSLKP